MNGESNMNLSSYLIYAQNCLLGESSIWDDRSNSLYWIDIVRPAIHRFNFNKNQHNFWLMPDKIACIGLNKSGGLFVVLSRSFALFDPDNTSQIKLTPLNTPQILNQNVMFNDGKCDRSGRFWVGTKDLSETAPNGNFYKLNADLQLELVDQKFTVFNGPAWSPDNKICYFCDSPQQIIYKCDFNLDTGTLHHKEVFAKVVEKNSYPDGITVDSDGFLWCCHWGGGRVVRYDPTGKISQTIKIPALQPTSCCFGGPHLTLLYVTSAIVGLSRAQLEQYPESGCVFHFETHIKGLKEPMVLLKAHL